MKFPSTCTNSTPSLDSSNFDENFQNLNQNFLKFRTESNFLDNQDIFQEVEFDEAESEGNLIIDLDENAVELPGWN